MKKQLGKVDNILSTFDAATALERSQGRQWYRSAHDFCHGLSDRYRVPQDRVTAVVAILSPRIPWAVCMANSETFLSDGRVPTFDRSNAKCSAVVQEGTSATYSWNGRTELLPALSGPKVQSFYLNMLLLDATDAVTVDRHAVDCADGLRRRDSTRTRIDTWRTYQPYVDLYRAAARAEHLPPHVLQATVWLTWRRLHHVVDASTVLEDF